MIGTLDRSGVTEIEHETLGIFAELDYMITDQLKLTLGGRYTDEEKDVLFNAIGSCYLDFSSCPGRVAEPNAGFTSNDFGLNRAEVMMIQHQRLLSHTLSMMT